jgi:hypothetical protein
MDLRDGLLTGKVKPEISLIAVVNKTATERSGALDASYTTDVDASMVKYPGATAMRSGTGMIGGNGCDAALIPKKR